MKEPSTPPKYLEVLARHLADVTQGKGLPSGVHHVEIYHDSWCAVFDGGTCDCEPDIASGPLVDAKYTRGGEDE